MTEEIEQNWQSWTGFAIVEGVALAVVIAIMIVAGVSLALIGRRKRWAGQLSSGVRWPFRITLLLVALTVSISALPVSGDLRGGLAHLFGILVIISGAWLLAHLFLFFVDSSSQRSRIAQSDTFSARKIRTQLQIVRRLVIVVIVVVAAGGILMTFDAVRAVGASVLASAGIASIVAGLAAQSVLSNLFAGVQLAFSEAIRVGDVVVVEGQYGRINEITLSYVVLELWDQRTLVLPCTYFTTNPFENWTKLGKALLGTVYFELDWRVPVDEMRLELERILAQTELWDRASHGVQVTDAVGGMLQVRILVSADDSGRLWDLRCLVREKLAEWVRTTHPEALPLQRVRIDEKPMDATVVQEQPAAG